MGRGLWAVGHLSHAVLATVGHVQKTIVVLMLLIYPRHAGTI